MHQKRIPEPVDFVAPTSIFRLYPNFQTQTTHFPDQRLSDGVLAGGFRIFATCSKA